MKKASPRSKSKNKGKSPNQTTSKICYPFGAYPLIIASFIALCLTTWRYFAPLSGITGAGGALLAIFGTFMLIVAGIILLKLRKGCWRIVLLILSWLGALGTLAALLLLHGWVSALFLAIGILALAYESFAFILRRKS